MAQSRAAARGIRVGVADEEDGLFFLAGHAEGQFVGGGALGHHACGEDEYSAAGELHVQELLAFQDNELQGLRQLEIGVAAIGRWALRS